IDCASRTGVAGKRHDFVATRYQTACDIAAHPAQSYDRDLHVGSYGQTAFLAPAISGAGEWRRNSFSLAEITRLAAPGPIRMRSTLRNIVAPAALGALWACGVPAPHTSRSVAWHCHPVELRRAPVACRSSNRPLRQSWRTRSIHRNASQSRV